MGDLDKKSLALMIKRSYLYRFYAFLFLFMGFGLFGYFYYSRIQPDFDGALQSPTTIMLFFLPFLPGGVLSIRANQMQRKARKMLHQMQ